MLYVYVRQDTGICISISGNRHFMHLYNVHDMYVQGILRDKYILYLKPA